LTRHLATDSFTSKLQSPSGTRSSRWRRSKGSATLSTLSTRCLSSRRSLDDYQGPTDASARTFHSVRIPSTNDVPLHPRRYDYHWSGVGLYFVWLPDHANDPAHFVGAERRADFVLYRSIAISLTAARNLHIVVRSSIRLITELARHIVPPELRLPWG
jgi:hypothetical protein